MIRLVSKGSTISSEIIKQNNIHFCHEFAQNTCADLEDLFTKEEYLKMFVEAFPEHKHITAKTLDPSIPQIVEQINRAIGKERYNHYRPAYLLAQGGTNAARFSAPTLDAFEKMFVEINKQF